MAKIVFFNTNKAWGGGEKWHFSMAEELAKRGHKILLLVYPSSKLALKAVENNMPSIEVNVGKLSFLNLIKIKKVRVIFNQFKADVVITNLPSDMKLGAMACRTRPDIKLIYRRGMPHPIKASAINKRCLARVDIIVANSEEIKRSVSKNMPSLVRKIKVIYNGVIPSGNAPRVLSSPFKIGAMGRLVSQKGFHHLIGIARELSKFDIEYSIKIAGTGDMRDRLHKLVADAGLQKLITFIGHVESHEFFQSIDLFAFTSHYEGSANAIIEAQDHGVVPIAFDISSMPEMIENGFTGILVRTFSETAFAKAIYDLSQDPSKYRLMSQRCIDQSKNKFSFFEKVNELESLF